jgi:hypothetical protein
VLTYTVVIVYMGPDLTRLELPVRVFRNEINIRSNEPVARSDCVWIVVGDVEQRRP